jgi:hypothetical protein
MIRLKLQRPQFSLALFAAVVVLIAADTSSHLPSPPVAKKVPKITEIHGRKLVDNYFWLRDKKNPEVRAYLEAENVYTEAVMKPTKPLQDKLYTEMLSRIKETDVEVPYKEGAYFYYSRTEAGKQYSIHCRKRGSLDAPEEVVLDINELAKGQAFMRVAAYDVSEDGNLLAYSTDTTGFRQYVLAVKDCWWTTRRRSVRWFGRMTTGPSFIPSKMPPSVNIVCTGIQLAPPVTMNWFMRKRTKDSMCMP